MKISNRSIALIGMLAGLTVVVNLVFHHIFFYLFTLVVLSLKKRDSLLYAFVVSLVNFLSYVSIFTGINVIVLPITALVIRKLFDVNAENGMSKPSLNFAISLASVFLLSNIFYDILRVLLYSATSFNLGLLFVTLPYSVLTAVGNAILFYLTGMSVLSKTKPFLEV